MTSKVTELLAADQVTIAIDTNIIVQCYALAALPWRELAPAATTVRVIVPQKVISEMDQHKFSSGRLRKRAAEFSELVRRLEENNYAPLVLKDHGPKVTVEFGRAFKSTELDSAQFELADPDSRIVAEVVKISSEIRDLVLLADDGRPIHLAYEAGLPRIRPPATWRRPDDADERDQKIADYERQLGAQPLLVIAFPGAETEERHHYLRQPPNGICPQCTERIVAAALSVDPQVPRSKLEERYPDARRPSNYGRFTVSFPIPGQVNSSDLDDYEDGYAAFEKNLRSWVGMLPTMLQAIFPLSIEVGNDGTKAADRVHLEAVLNGPFHFRPLDMFDTLLEDMLEPPDVPRPFSFEQPYLRDLFGDRQQRPDQFHSQDEPEAAGGTKRITWRCEEFRQGTRYAIPTLIVAEQPLAKGAITVTAGAAALAKKTIVTAPLQMAPNGSSGSFATYLQDRLALVPSRYHDELLIELRRPDTACTCDSNSG
ncbi:hypothetical protein ASD04_11290 [Devosia sp. Root436]|uniref:PIN domain-containing protein n=1 Tax=Devosia sp. Root436 TaxID=1736537 RepID=UPI0006F4C58D|nr:PIN domain-containing protein [Devosia sp. Root436]KQX38196.1 hypothetical protein ASD04_11290 [Devosia sp. Root436]